MPFLLPIALLSALALPALIVLYLLKVRRSPRRVSSTLLWRAAMEEAEASTPFQRLRRNWLMILQLIALALLALAVARPVLNMKSRRAGTVAVVVDVSASMTARSGLGSGNSRLDEAKTTARAVIGGLPSGSQGVIIALGANAEAVSPLTADRTALRRAIDSLGTRVEEDNAVEALALAASLLKGAPAPQIVVISDQARLGDREREAAGGVAVSIETCGAPTANIGWTAFDLTRNASGGGGYDFFGRLTATGGGERRVRVKIYLNDTLAEVREAALKPGEDTPVIVRAMNIEGEPVLRAVLEPLDDHGDALAVDNAIWAQVRPAAKLRILACSAGNVFLDRALAAMEDAEVTAVPPGAAAPAGEFDLLIAERAMPAPVPPVPAILFGVNPWGALPAEEPAGDITNWDTTHPATAQVQWSTVTVFGARKIAPPPGTRVLAESGDLPVILLGRAAGQEAIVCAFDLFRTNLPLRAGFPIFLKDAAEYLTRDRRGREVAAIRAGESFTVKAASQTAEAHGSAKLIAPGGRSAIDLTANADQVFTASNFDAAGLWRIEPDGAPAQSFGVNLLSARESDTMLAPSGKGEEMTTAQAAAAAPQSNAASSGNAPARELRGNEEVWRWLAAVALGLLAIEWYAYTRRPRSNVRGGGAGIVKPPINADKRR